MAENESKTNTEETTEQAEEAKAKYTQDDFNKAMANKEREVKKQFDGKKVLTPEELQDLLDKATQKGADRATMTAEEKAKADEADRQKALEAERKSAADEMANMKARMSLYETKDALVDAGLPTTFADFLSDVDVDARNTKIDNFKQAFTQAVDAAVTEKLKGSKSPQAGASPASQPKVTKTQPPVDPTSMSVVDFMKTE